MAHTDESEFKRKFAYLLVKNRDNAFRAAMDLLLESGYPLDKNHALRIATAWIDDYEVLREKSRIKIENPDLWMPTENEILNMLWTIANSECQKASDRIDALKLLTELKGLKGNNSKDKVTNVMLVPSVSMELWDEEAVKQQRSMRTGN